MHEKFTVFADVAKGFARRYVCDDVDGLYFVVLYRGNESVYGVVCGKIDFGRHSGISYDVFMDNIRDCEYFYVQYNNTLVRFSSNNFEDVSITTI